MTGFAPSIAFTHADEGLALLDGDGSVVVANPVAVEQLSLGPDHAGTSLSEFPLEVRTALAGRGLPGDLVPGSTDADGAETDPVAVDVSRVEADGFSGFLLTIRDGEPRDETPRYRAILEATGDAVYTLDADGICTYSNRAHDELFGYDEGEMVGMPVSAVIDEATIERLEDEVRALLLGDGPPRTVIEHEVITSDGERVPVENHVSLLLDEEGEFYGTAGVVRDVGERKERDHDLERYETLLEIMPDTVVVTNTEGVIEDLHGFEGWSGYDVDELVGEHLSKTTPEESVERAEAHLAELLTDDGPDKVTYEMDVVTRDGERIPHENHLALLPPDEDGTIPGSISVLRDISERKAHERALEALNETTRELVAVESRGEVVEMAVRTATGVLDLPLAGVWLYDDDAEALVPASYPDAEELPDHPPTFRPGESLAWEVFESGRPRIYDQLAERDDVHNPETEIRSEVVTPIGDHGVLVAGSTEPEAFGEDQRNLAGVLGAAVGTALDRLDREREREEQRRELRRKNEQLEQFAGVLSHDLRNPLNVAHARVRDAVRSGDTEKLESADEALVRMNELIGDLLTLAREGRIVGEVHAVSLAAAAEEAWRSVEAPDASLSVEDDPRIEADRARLCELFENLFRNSVEHAAPDVRVRVGSLPDGGFYVEDDGPGVPEELCDRAFEQGVTSAAGGTGFGLAIVASIAEAHGWTVSLVEGSEGGARFEFEPGDPTGDGGVSPD